MSNITFMIIKPDAIKKKLTGKILNYIIVDGKFIIKAIKQTLLTNRDVDKFYSIHKKSTFFNSLTAFMTSGPVWVGVLEKKNAVNSFRKLIGSTNPKKAADNTIRKLYGESIEKNVIHGSDSDETAKIESLFFFSSREIFLN